MRERPIWRHRAAPMGVPADRFVKGHSYLDPVVAAMAHAAAAVDARMLDEPTKPAALLRRWRVQQDDVGWLVLRSLLPDETIENEELTLSITAAGLPVTAFEIVGHVETRELLSASVTASGGKLVDVGYHEAVQLLAKMFQDALATDPEIDPEAGLLAEHWQSDKGICFNEKTGDGRDFTNCDWTWRDPESSLLPLMLQTENDYGHFGAELAGFFESISKKAKAVTAAGRFYDCEIGEQFRDMLLGGRRFGVSVDPGAVTADMQCVDQDEDGWCNEMAIIFEAYEIIGLTGTGFPAFAEASIMLDPKTVQAEVDDEDEEMRAASANAEHTDETAGEHETAETRSADDELAAQSAVVDAELLALSKLSDATIVDMQANGLALHSSYTGSHMHRHSAAGSQGGDSTHEHLHKHDGDASHTGASHKSSTGHANKAKPMSVINASGASTIPTRPPREWFELSEPEYGQLDWLDGQPASEFLVEQEDGALAVPFTILDDGRCFGNLARWGQCHIGYPGQCVSPPEEATFEHFNVGEVVCEDGSRVATGTLTAGCDHAATHMRAPQARDHYAHSGVGWANVHVTSGLYGPWAVGCLRADVTEEQLAVYRASAPSGDWRRIGNALRLVSVLAVNTPGFPIAREAVTASGLALVASVNGPRAYVESGVPMSLVAAGIVTRCADCAKRRAAEAAAAHGTFTDDDRAMLRHLDATVTSVEKRTRHLALAERQRLLDEMGVTTKIDAE